MKRKAPVTDADVTVLHASLEPHSVKISRGVSGGTAIEVKVYSANEADAAERALATYLKVQRDLAREFLKGNKRPFNTS